jgi:hypothetical protein
MSTVNKSAIANCKNQAGVHPKNRLKMLRTLATSLIRSGRVSQIQNRAGIFTTTRSCQNTDDENGSEGRRAPNFEKSLNSVTLLGRQLTLFF